MFQRRNDLEIIADILVKAKHGVRKTRIMYRCNLCHKQVEMYLSFLKEKNLLQNSNQTFQTTDKGIQYLVQLRDLKKLL